MDTSQSTEALVRQTIELNTTASESMGVHKSLLNNRMMKRSVCHQQREKILVDRVFAA